MNGVLRSLLQYYLRITEVPPLYPSETLRTFLSSTSFRRRGGGIQQKTVSRIFVDSGALAAVAFFTTLSGMGLSTTLNTAFNLSSGWSIVVGSLLAAGVAFTSRLTVELGLLNGRSK